jgi:hypothetical protein
MAMATATSLLPAETGIVANPQIITKAGKAVLFLRSCIAQSAESIDKTKFLSCHYSQRYDCY